jgi:hypothetical protein
MKFTHISRIAIALLLVVGTPVAPAKAQAGGPSLTDTVNTLVGLCTTVRQDFGTKAREAGWPYDMATGQRSRQLSFGKVTVASQGEFACVITFAMSGGTGSDVVAAVERWSRTGDPKSALTRNSDGSVQISGSGYLMRAESGANAAAIWVKLV